MALPAQARIREVGPRDGFQNEREVIPTAEKVRLIDMLGRTGVRRLEVTSFVRPDVIPQLADAEEVLERIDVPAGVELSVLVPNERGLDAGSRAAGALPRDQLLPLGVREPQPPNVGASVEESLAGARARARPAPGRAGSVRTR